MGLGMCRRQESIGPSLPATGAIGVISIVLSFCLVVSDLDRAAATQIQGPNAVSAAPGDPLFEAARQAFEALPEDQRHAMQEALIWASNFTAVTSGSFGKRTFDAVLQFQKKHGLPSTGILDSKLQATLIAEALSLKQSVNFSIQADARSGLRIGLPLKLMNKTAPLANGTRWDSSGGSYSIETNMVPSSDSTFAGLFDKLRLDGPQRKVTYKLMRPDWFVLSGETANRRFYTRYAQGNSDGARLVRGFTWTYTNNAPLADALTIAIANSFEPFPPLPASPIAAASTSVPIASAPLRLVATATVIAPGRLLTTLAAPFCPTLTVGSRQAHVVQSDPASGLALLEVEGLPNPAIKSGIDRFHADVPVLVVGFIDMPTDQLAVIPADAVLSASGIPSVQGGLQNGANGSLVFDRNGVWRGAVAPMPVALRRVAGIVPQAKWPVVDAAGIAEFLDRAGFHQPAAAAPENHTTAAIAAAAADSLSEVWCQQP
jgi:peptidoglycan hydrolase-like protein with peptidoglycan-binding domain